MAVEIVEQEETESISEDRVNSAPIKKSFAALIDRIAFTILIQMS